MAGILWLASYPKSGNTWLRIFLANLFADPERPFDINDLGRYVYGEMSADLYERVAGRPLSSLSEEDLHGLRPQVHRLLTRLRPDTVLVKTHNAIAVWNGVATITPEATEGAIYVVRNPLDVAISYADHYGIDIDEAISAMSSPQNRTVTQPGTVFQFLGDWSGHVRSWNEAPGLKCHVVRYEDLLDRTRATFAGIVNFLGVEAPRRRLNRAIRFSSFAELRNQERRHGFHEKSRSSKAFFRNGRTGQWKGVLSEDQVRRLTDAHGSVMRQFGYLE